MSTDYRGVKIFSGDQHRNGSRVPVVSVCLDDAEEDMSYSFGDPSPETIADGSAPWRDKAAAT